MSTLCNHSPSQDDEERPTSPITSEQSESNNHEDPVSETYTMRPDEKYGFIIFRTVYGDENEWERFMVYLNAQVRASLEEKGQGDMIPYIDWKVQSSPDLESASFEDIRKRFNEWVESGEELIENSPRSDACIVVNGDCFYDVMGVLDFLEEEGLPMDEWDHDGLAWVNLVSKSDSEGSVRVCVSNLMPRTFNFVPELWEHIASDGRNQPRI